MENIRFLKVMFGTKSGASNFEYKLNEVNIANVWNPAETEPDKMGGFNFSTETKILRWLVRGDTIYDIEIPEGAEVIDVPHPTTPHGVFRANKIIISNPRPVTDELAMELYKISDIPEKSYYKALAGLAIRGCIETCKLLIKERVNKDNIDLVLSEINDFTTPNSYNHGNQKVYDEVMRMLNEIKV